MKNAVSAICHKPFYNALWRKLANIAKCFLIHSSPVTCTITGHQFWDNGYLDWCPVSFAKAPICRGFPIPFNKSRLYGDSETVAVEPVWFSPGKPFNDWYVGMSTFLVGMSICKSINLFGWNLRIRFSWFFINSSNSMLLFSTDGWVLSYILLRFHHPFCLHPDHIERPYPR